MANMKTDDSGIITTEFYTGRCPVRCELCFTNFGQNGSSIPFNYYSRGNQGIFDYASCKTTQQRTKRKDGKLDYVQRQLCGPGIGKGRNNKPRKWSPVVGVDANTGQEVTFRANMDKNAFKRVLKPLGDDPGLYNIPKIPELPWYHRVLATRTYNGQWLPSILRVNSMSDSSVAPSEWIAAIRELWGDDCFFNSNIHAIKAYPANLKAGLYHKMVITANPGLQQLYPGLERYLDHYPTKEEVASDSIIIEIARELYQGLKYAPRGDVEEYIISLPWDEIKGLVTIALGADTMKGEKERAWHFYKPARLMDLQPEYEQFEQNIKFYRVRALPTIQPDVAKFNDVPVVYTVLRFKTVLQVLEFASKYNIDVECVIKNRKDAIVCEWFNVPYREAETNESTMIALKSDDPLNHSPKRGQWTELTFSHNFFRSTKEQMDQLEYVCDRAGKSCKACGLCATLDGTESGWENPVLAQLDIHPKRFSQQSSFVCDSNGEPVPTAGVTSKTDMTPVPKGIGRSREEMDFFYGPGERKYWDIKTLTAALKQKKRQAKRRHNPQENAGNPAVAYMAVLDNLREDASRHRNPDDWGDLLIQSLDNSLKIVVDYGAQSDGEEYWWQGWNTHEEVASLVAYVFWWLMVLAHDEGLDEAAAVEAAIEFSYDACGMNLFDSDLEELALMYFDRSYWTDQYGSTTFAG